MPFASEPLTRFLGSSTRGFERYPAQPSRLLGGMSTGRDVRVPIHALTNRTAGCACSTAQRRLLSRHPVNRRMQSWGAGVSGYIHDYWRGRGSSCLMGIAVEVMGWPAWRGY